MLQDMNQLLNVRSASFLPQIIASADKVTRNAFLNFFAAQIRNVNTRRAYMRAARQDPGAFAGGNARINRYD